MFTTGLPLELWREHILPHLGDPVRHELTRVRLRRTCHAFHDMVGRVAEHPWWILRQAIRESRPALVGALAARAPWEGQVGSESPLVPQETVVDTYPPASGPVVGHWERLSQYAIERGDLACFDALRGPPTCPCPVNIGTLLAALQSNDEVLFSAAIERYLESGTGCAFALTSDSANIRRSLDVILPCASTKMAVLYMRALLRHFPSDDDPLDSVKLNITTRLFTFDRRDVFVELASLKSDPHVFTCLVEYVRHIPIEQFFSDAGGGGGGGGGGDREPNHLIKDPCELPIWLSYYDIDEAYTKRAQGIRREYGNGPDAAQHYRNAWLALLQPDPSQ